MAEKTKTTIKKAIVQEDEGSTNGVAEAAVQPEQLSAKDQKEVKIIERVIENHEIAPADAFGKLTRPQVALIKQTVAKGATDDELRLFIQVCKGAKLNPFMKQVHFVKRWDSREGKEVGAIQVGIDGFRAVAEGSGQYAGNDDPVYEGDKEIDAPATKAKAAGKIMVPAKATVTVYKLLEGQRYAFTATARWDEYYPGQKMGFQWHIRPYLMLGKCAEALALRKAFPTLLSGMYAAEEMEKGHEEDNEQRRTIKKASTIREQLAKANPAEVEELAKMVDASDKYTPQQKTEFAKLVEQRRQEFAPKE